MVFGILTDYLFVKPKPIAEMQQQYAKFCMELDAPDSSNSYENAIKDYNILISIPGVEYVGIDWTSLTLLVGTECIDAMYYDVGKKVSTLKELGEYIIKLSPKSKTVHFENITRTVGGCLHPHIYNHGRMCLGDGLNEAMCAMAECQFSHVVRIFLTALRMNSNQVKIGSAYPDAELVHWPNKSEVAK